MNQAEKRAKLVLVDGTVFEGRSVGADGECVGEVVFNTAMSGYQEVLTDPSYAGQIVTMTSPLIGNYGVNASDVESHRTWLEGFVMKEMSPVASNFRSEATLRAYLEQQGIIAIDDIDTRALTRKLRVDGAMNGILSTRDLDDDSLLTKARLCPLMEGRDLVQEVSLTSVTQSNDFLTLPQRSYRTLEDSEQIDFGAERFRVACLDYGIKHNIVRMLSSTGFDVTIFPASTPSAEILKSSPDGVFLSNGPGDPAAVSYAVSCVKDLIHKGVPIFGICLGHQIVNLAMGAKTFKLKFGHHGVNHPVKNLETNTIEVTSQNHGFGLDENSVIRVGGEVTHVSMNDETIEGTRYKSYPIFSVQYHPESAPGPHDSRYLFTRFREMICDQKKGVHA